MARKLVEFDDVAAAAQSSRTPVNAQRSSLSETSLARELYHHFNVSQTVVRGTLSMKSW